MNIDRGAMDRRIGDLRAVLTEHVVGPVTGETAMLVCNGCSATVDAHGDVSGWTFGGVAGSDFCPDCLEMAVRWFGEDWGGAICLPGLRVDTPVGKPCSYARCLEPIEADDIGVSMKVLDEERAVLHLDCWLKSIGIPPCPDPRGPGCTCASFKHNKDYRP